MADFTADLQSFRPPFPFLDIDPSMVALSQFTEVSQAILDNPSVNNIHSFMPFTSDNFFSHQAPEFPGNLAEGFAGIFHQNDQNVMPVSQPFTTPGNESEFQESKKRKAMDVSESSSMNSSPQVSEIGSKRRNVNVLNQLSNSTFLATVCLFWSLIFVHLLGNRTWWADSMFLITELKKGKGSEKQWGWETKRRCSC